MSLELFYKFSFEIQNYHDLNLFKVDNLHQLSFKIKLICNNMLHVALHVKICFHFYSFELFVVKERQIPLSNILFLYLFSSANSIHLGSLLAAHGYFFPITDHVLTLKDDNTFYRFQTPYFWPSNCWEPENTDYGKSQFIFVYKL